MQKRATPSKRHGEIMKKHGMSPVLWYVRKELGFTLVLIHRVTGEVRVIEKQEAVNGQS